MDMLKGEEIAKAGLNDWRKLAQRLHARFRAGDPGVGAALVSDAVRAAGEVSLGGHLEATLTATQDGTAATVTVTSAINAPLALDEDSIASTLTFVNANGGTTTFTGTENPAIAAGDPVTVGPLNGTVASGDSLESYGGSLQIVVFGITVTCTATGPRRGGTAATTGSSDSVGSADSITSGSTVSIVSASSAKASGSTYSTGSNSPTSPVSRLPAYRTCSPT